MKTILKYTLKSVILLFLMSISKVISAEETTQVQLKRYALIIGSNTGSAQNAKLQYAVSDANAFSRVLTEMGGVNKEDLIYVTNPTLQDFIASINALSTKVKKVQDIHCRKEIIIYYSGHANESGILLNTELFPYPQFRKMIDTIPVDVRIAVLDACSSGSLTREKGGTKRQPFLFDASAEMKGHAFLTSSSFDEAAQESDRIKGSFFTHYLISAMRGGADVNNDGKVTLNEAYEFAFDETLKRTEKTLSGPQHAEYDIRLKGSGDLVMTDLRTSSAGLRLSASVSGRLFVRDKQGMLLAELNKFNEKPMEVGLEPGTYQITLEKRSQILSANITLIQGQYTDLTENILQPVQAEVNVNRGQSSQNVKTDSLHDYRRIPFNLSFLPWLSFGGTSGKILTNSSISILAGYTSKLQGVDITSGINVVSEKSQGVLISAASNICRGSVDGIQITGAVNTAAETSHCAQIAGAFNQAQSLFGLQIAGGANIASDTIIAVQIAGGINIANSNFSGLQITGGLNQITGCSSYGMQIAGGVNIAQKGCNGGQISGGINLSPNNLKGLQIAGGANITSVSSKGLQIAGGANITSGPSKGLQIAGGINIASDMKGMQLGTINSAHNVKGVQLGVINVCDSAKGVLIGVLSIVRSCPPRFRLWTDEAGYIQTTFKSGTKSFYSLFTLGIRPELDRLQWCLGYGIGGNITIQNAYINIETHLLHSNLEGNWDTNQILHMREMVSIGYQFAPHFSIWAGPSFNMYWSTTPPTEKKLSYWHINSIRYQRFWYACWPGFAVGIEI
jgi:hypothetical protein